MKTHLAAIVLLLLWIPAAEAGIIRDDRADASYTGLAASYPSVGLMLWPGFLASGTLIENPFETGEHWVLTAAHVLDGAAPAGQYTFDLRDGGGSLYTGLRKYVNPNWTGDVLAGWDVGLLRLASNETAVDPAALFRGSSQAVLGKVGTYVGYGVTGTGLTGYIDGTYGTKRTGNNRIDVDGSFFSNVSSRVFLTDFDNPHDPAGNVLGSAVPLNLEYTPSFGDSGGGLFVGSGAGAKLVGVTSFITGSEYGDLAGSTGVSSREIFNWIYTTIRDDEGVVPEPAGLAVWSLLLVSVAVLAGWRKAGGAVRP